jgi:hypothetical protein
MLATALAKKATKWLDFDTVPSPNPPSTFSQIRRFTTSQHRNR